jgi:hypothetical protein
MATLIDDIRELQLGPVGWGILAIGGLLALSPAARRSVRRALVYSIASLRFEENWNSFRADIREQVQAQRARAGRNREMRSRDRSPA